MSRTVENSTTIHDKALYLHEIGEPFVLKKINSTFTLECEYFGNSSSRASQKLTGKELAFIKKVKKYIRDNDIDLKFLEKNYFPNDIQYVKIKKHPKDYYFKDCIEIDIDQAYWITAYQLGVISKEIYEQGSKEKGNISKLARLVSLGSLAKKTSIYYFDGKRLRKETERSDETENIWYSICKRLSDAMVEASKIAKEDFYLYWVDGIYVKNNPDTVNNVISVFEKYGYNVKTKNSLEIRYDEERVYVEDINASPDKKKKIRPFFIKKNNQDINYYTDKELQNIALTYSKYGVVDDIN